MEFVILIGAGVLCFFSWILWGILIAGACFLAVVIPWAIWELFMFLTFNNIINLFAKLPSIIGAFFGFVLTLPFAIIATTVSIWAYAQALLMGLLTFHGNANLEFCKTFVEKMIVPWESQNFHSFFIVRFYYEHCQWIWGGAAFNVSYFPWQNGVWANVGEMLPIPIMILKLLIMAIPYFMMFVLPILPVIWSVLRPFVGGAARLPAVSGNGDGRD